MMFSENWQVKWKIFHKAISLQEQEEAPKSDFKINIFPILSKNWPTSCVSAIIAGVDRKSLISPKLQTLNVLLHFRT